MRDSVYLQPDEVAELLVWVRERPVSPWVYTLAVDATVPPLSVPAANVRVADLLP